MKTIENLYIKYATEDNDDNNELLKFPDSVRDMFDLYRKFDTKTILTHQLQENIKRDWIAWVTGFVDDSEKDSYSFVQILGRVKDLLEGLEKVMGQMELIFHVGGHDIHKKTKWDMCEDME